MYRYEVQRRYGSMIDIFLIALFNAGVIFGINKATSFEYCHPEDLNNSFCDEYGIDKDSKMALWWLRHGALKLVGEFWSKPLFTCPPCMASVHGTWVYFMLMPFGWSTMALWPVYILFLSGLVTLIQSVTKYGSI